MSHGDTAPPYARFESISRSVRTTAHTHLSIWVEPGQDAAVAHLASHERVDPQPKGYGHDTITAVHSGNEGFAPPPRRVRSRSSSHYPTGHLAARAAPALWSSR